MKFRHASQKSDEFEFGRASQSFDGLKFRRASQRSDRFEFGRASQRSDGLQNEVSTMSNNSNARVASKKFWMQKAQSN